ncbi:unnamed protein product [Rhizophagus irregularis]|nr:unnamed protein product [Rhizophagus irregularis]
MTKKKGAVWKHWTIITQNQTESNKNNSHPTVQCSTTSTIHTPTITPNTTHTNIPVKRIKITQTSKIENFVDRMSEKEQDDLEFQLAQALFSAGVPFAFVENSLVIQFFKCLRPSFKLPNRRKLAGDLLNDVYDEVKLQTEAKTLCIVSDGWSNINRESVQNFIICTPKPVFFNATFSGEEFHTGE